MPSQYPNPEPQLSPDEAQLLEGLRNADESAFANIVDQYSGSLLRLAMAYVPTRAIAEEVVQETWLAVLEGLGRFEGRSSFKTWLFRILTNRAKTRGKRESRYETFSSLSAIGDERQDPAVEPDRLVKTGFWVDHWASPPNSWDEETPERIVLSKEGREQIDKAIQKLPLTQRQVITLRDIEGLSSQEICNLLGVSETNQRVLLHRARSRVRHALEQYLDTNRA